MIWDKKQQTNLMLTIQSNIAVGSNYVGCYKTSGHYQLLPLGNQKTKHKSADFNDRSALIQGFG